MNSNLLAKRYRLLRLIGKGGMADVYLALDEILNREVAIKVMKGELTGDEMSVLRFKREAMATTKLIHPNIVEVYDVGEEGSHHFIVMEYVKGHTLKRLLNKRSTIAVEEAVFIMKQLTAALSHAHEKGIIHRDIKPQNIIIKDDGTVKILDFGIALAHDAMQITSNNSVLGSVHYLAPELSKGTNASVQSDIYALGVVFYELLAGKVPFVADNPIDVAVQHLKSEFPSIRKENNEIYQSIENIILKCVMKDPKNRYASIVKLQEDLNRCMDDKYRNQEKIKLEETVDSLQVKKEKTKIKRNYFLPVFISVLTIFTIFLIVLILYISGILQFGSKYSKVPDLKNLTVLQAQELLQDSSLSIDLANIERMLTDDVEKGKIISYSPNENEEVEKGTKIKVVVSDGKYAVIGDYVGRNIKEVKQEIRNNFEYINIIEEALEQEDVESGTIIRQELQEKGSKVDPNKIQDIKLVFAAYPSVIIPHNVLDMSVEEVKELFERKKIRFITEQYDRSLLSEQQQQKLHPGAIVDIDPKPGISYTQEDNNVVVIKYY